MARPRYLPAGETALSVEFGQTADPVLLEQVLALDAALAAHPIQGILETVPTYRSLTVHYDPAELGFDDIVARLAAVETSALAPRAPRHWVVPACYEAPHAEDLPEVARALGVAPEAVAARHAEATYTVVMYGFAPGFVFLGGLPGDLHIPRRRTPRPPAPAGALTIANGQALIASIAMPTGWYMLGRTPVRTFDPGRDPTFPIAIGDSVSFERIDAARFADIEREVGAGRDPLRAAG